MISVVRIHILYYYIVHTFVGRARYTFKVFFLKNIVKTTVYYDELYPNKKP